MLCCNWLTVTGCSSAEILISPGTTLNTETITLPPALVSDPNHYWKKESSIYHLKPRTRFIVEQGAAGGSGASVEIIYMFSEEFEGTLSPLKESLGRNGCLCWSRHARHRVSNAACVSLHGLSSDLWLFYGNTKYHNNIPPSCVSRQGKNEFFFFFFFFLTTESFDLSSWNHVVLPAVIWGIADCCLDFCFQDSFFRVWTSTFPQTTAEDRQNLSWHTSYSSPHSLNLPPSFTSVTRTTFLLPFLTFSPSVVFLPPFFPPWALCSSLNTAGTHQHLYQLWLPSIYSHTHSSRAVTQRSSSVPPTNRQEAPMMQCDPAQTHMWSISWCNSLRSFSSPGNTRLTVLTCSPPTTTHTLAHRQRTHNSKLQGRVQTCFCFSLFISDFLFSRLHARFHNSLLPTVN